MARGSDIYRKFVFDYDVNYYGNESYSNLVNFISQQDLRLTLMECAAAIQKRHLSMAYLKDTVQVISPRTKYYQYYFIVRWPRRRVKLPALEPFYYLRTAVGGKTRTSL